MNNPEIELNNIIQKQIMIQHRSLYLEIYNIMSNVHNNFENRIFRKEKYNVLMVSYIYELYQMYLSF